MELSRPMSVVTTSVDGEVLAALALADAAFTPGQLHRLIGRHSEAGVRKSLTRLGEQGIVRSERAGNAYLYSLNRAHLAAQHVQGLARMRDELLQRLSQRLASWSTEPIFAALFGSAARGDMTLHSDLDVLVVRPHGVEPDVEPWRSDIDSLTHDLTAWTGNDARVLELSYQEAVTAAEVGGSLVRAIRAEGLTLHGDVGVLVSRQTPASEVPYE